MTDKKTIYLINPSSGLTSTGMTECLDLLGYKAQSPNLAHPTLATLVDEDLYHVVICDEEVEPINIEMPCDIVGFTSYHYHPDRIHRLYGFAREFKMRGRTVIMGGPYVTLNGPEEGAPIDVWFRGEAERTWPQFLSDYRKGDLKSLYQENQYNDITTLSPPRMDLLRTGCYFAGILQISRGCPYNCEFCSSILVAGRAMRYKTDTQIIAELEQLHGLGYRHIGIADDNFAGNRKRAKEILRLIKGWNTALDQPVKFVATNLSIDAVRDPELVSLLSETPVTWVFIGIESPNQASLRETRKFQNVQANLQEDIEKLHRHGIEVSAGMIVGFDHDDHNIFKMHADFLQQTMIPITTTGMLIALNGTALKQRLAAEGRCLPKHPSIDSTFETNILPKKMSADELRNGYLWLLNQIYDEENYTKRVEGLLSRFPRPNSLLRRFKGREIRNRRIFIPFLIRLSVYYLTNGKALRRMFNRFLIMMFRYHDHAQQVLLWLIIHKHFREWLIKRGVWRRNFVPPWEYHPRQ